VTKKPKSDPDFRPEFEELARHFMTIPYPRLRTSLLQLLVMLPHLDRDTALELIEEYFPITDLIREHEEHKETACQIYQ
jgi:hypothetical protein